MKLDAACLNVMLNIAAYYHRVDTFVLVVFAVGSLLQLALTPSPMLRRLGLVVTKSTNLSRYLG